MRFAAGNFGLGFLTVGFAVLSVRAQAPTIPPTVYRVSPPGLARGSTVVLTLEGRNLAGARAILFDAPGITGKVLGVTDLAEEVRVARPGVDTGALVAQGKKQEARLELTAAPDVEPGVHRFRVQTPLGTSNAAALDVGALAEIQEKEPNDPLASTQIVEWPATVAGTLAWPGDEDSFQFSGRAGQEMVFRVVASSLGSKMRGILTLRDASGKILARAGEFTRLRDPVLTFTLPADDNYVLTVSDLERGGGSDHFYRLYAGALPYLAEVFPLGVRAGETTEVEVKGANLGDIRKVKVQAPTYDETWPRIPLQVKTAQGGTLNKVWLTVGSEPEEMEAEPNDSVAEAQAVTLPVTVNGHISGKGKEGRGDADYFRFTARKGQRLTIEVEAARLGSALDSEIEVLDAEGREIPRATVRSLSQTEQTLADRDSKGRNFRLVSLAGLRENDDLMIGDELVQIVRVPDQPDEDISVNGFGGERFALEGTSPHAHAVGTPIYKVQVLEPGKEFAPNGLPVFHLTHRNDDGGPGYGQDSRLDFTAPYDGEYRLRIKDVRGLEGEDFAYRLTIREAPADFRLVAEPSNPNIPRGGKVPVVVTANRALGYAGPIELEIKGLPRGITASPAIVPEGQDSTAVILSAAADASLAEMTPAGFEVVGHGRLGARELVRVADAGQPLRVVSVMPPPDLLVAAETPQVTLEAGKETTVTLHIERKNGFAGRVPCKVLNLPPGVSVVNVGLNGVLVPEGETTRTFTLRAEDWVRASEQPIFIVGTVESNAPTDHASAPLGLRVRSKEVASAGKPPATRP